MCTAATYKTADFYFGRTLDYEFSYGDEVTVTPRNYPLTFRHASAVSTHYPSSAWHMWRGIIRFIMMLLMRRGFVWRD